VNGKRATLGMQVSPQDTVAVDGKSISHKRRSAYLLFNKPKDCITTAKDERGRRTVLEIVNYHDRVFPVGRLDRNSTGVLLFTNDGELAHRLMHPRYGVEKTYYVVLDTPITRAHAKEIEQGVPLDGENIAPCKIEINPADKTELAVTMHEGRNRQVRRMFEELGYLVTKLDRILYAGLTARGIKRGEWRALTRVELSHLKKLTGISEVE
jgi:23S rRNA pseudouridine2605 synthase